MKKSFTILHTNDLHSNFIGMGPASDYTPFSLNDDQTLGGYARLAALIAQRRKAREDEGAVLVLDAGDFSMGTPFAAATRETGGELQLMGRIGYDATTLGNHEFDLGADGLGKAITVATEAGRIPVILAANTVLSGTDAALSDLQRLQRSGVIRPYLVIERGGLRFGVFGVLGKEAIFYTTPGAHSFSDAIETASKTVKVLRETEKVDVVICLSHGGLERDKDGRHTDGDDLRLPRAVPGIDIVVGGHSHTALTEAIIVNGRTPVVQAGLEGRCLGELVVSLDAGTNELRVESCRLHPVDDSVAGDPAIGDAIERFKRPVTEAVFAARGYGIDEPLAIAPRDLPNTFTDIAASTILANLCTDAFRKATQADIGFTAGGMIRAPLLRGKTGVVTVYDVFCVVPLGYGVVDATAGSALVTGYFTGLELKSLFEFCLVDNPAHPGEYFPRTSGARFHYNPSRPMFDVVTSIEVGNPEQGYHEIDISGRDERLFSVTTPLMLGVIVLGIPKLSKGKLPLVAKNREGQPLTSRIEALDAPHENSGFLLAPPGTVDRSSVALRDSDGQPREIKEWQAIMDHLRSLPATGSGQLPVIPVDGRASEVRAIKVG